MPDTDTVWDEVIDVGRIMMGRRTLLNLGRQLFGEPSGKLEAVLIAIDDADRLERMLDVILTMKSWKGLLAVK